MLEVMMWSAWGIVGLIILILDVIVIIDVLKSGMDTIQKLIWILVIILLPVLGLILYYLLGRR